jgi:hypothetical protein
MLAYRSATPILLALLCSSAAVGETPLAGGEFEISESLISSGHSDNGGGEFHASGSIAASPVEVVSSSGGEFQLQSGPSSNAIAPPAESIIFQDRFQETSP